VVVRNFLGTETTLNVYAQGFFVRLNNIGFTVEPEIILCVAPVLAILPSPPAVTSGVADCIDSVTVNRSTMAIFKVFNASSACVFAVIDDVTSLFQYNYTSIGKTVILFVQYKDNAPTIQEFATLECNDFVDDGRQQLMNQVFIDKTYIALRIESTLTITFQSVVTTVSLPPGATDVNVFLIYRSDLYQFDFFCMISNCSVEKMFFYATKLYISFTLYGVSTVYNTDQSVAFTVGAFGKTGKAIVQYDLSTSQFTLLGYYTTNS
jgi:hypothetical protein